MIAIELIGGQSVYKAGLEEWRRSSAALGPALEASAPQVPPEFRKKYVELYSQARFDALVSDDALEEVYKVWAETFTEEEINQLYPLVGGAITSKKIDKKMFEEKLGADLYMKFFSNVDKVRQSLRDRSKAREELARQQASEGMKKLFSSQNDQ